MSRDEVIDNWIALSLAEHYGDVPPVALIDKILARSGEASPATLPQAHRGLRLLVASAVVAAAATAALIFLLPIAPETTNEAPVVAPHDNEPEDDWELPDPMQTIITDKDDVVDVGPDEAVVTRGSVYVEVAAGETYTVKAGTYTVVVTGPATARVTMSPMRQMGTPMGIAMGPPTGDGTGNQAIAQLRSVPMVVLVMKLSEGTATLNGEKLTGPVTEQRILYPRTGTEPWAAPLSMAELFATLDENNDKSLREDEVTDELVAMLDADASGGITFTEFETLNELSAEKTPKVIPFSREFRDMDRDGNGKLTGDEIGEGIVRLADHDGSGGLELKEAERIFGDMGGGSGGGVVMDMFSHFDLDDNGEIGVDEIAPDVMLALDADENGHLDRKEFAKFRSEEFPEPLTPRQAFRRNDTNDDGELGSDEVPEAMIRMGDTDGDGKLTLAEFTDLVKKLAGEQK